MKGVINFEDGRKKETSSIVAYACELIAFRMGHAKKYVQAHCAVIPRKDGTIDIVFKGFRVNATVGADDYPTYRKRIRSTRQGEKE